LAQEQGLALIPRFQGPFREQAQALILVIEQALILPFLAVYLALGRVLAQEQAREPILLFQVGSQVQAQGLVVLKLLQQVLVLLELTQRLVIRGP
jgi:hypothetical protein